MKTIPLSRGYAALVDDADYEILASSQWSALVLRGKVYAIRFYGPHGHRKGEYMHRVILRTTGHVDHRDGNGLNNQRHNLRPATRKQNQQNRGAQKNNRLEAKGVTFHAGKYRATIKAAGKQKHLGRFETAEAASEAYRKAARELHGEFFHE